MGSEMQSQRAAAADLSGLYDEDFFEWTERSAQLLRAGEVRESDIRHIADAIEDLGRQDLKEPVSYTHLDVYKRQVLSLPLAAQVRVCF